MEPIPFRTLLLRAGVLTRDGRMIDVGALTWTCPMTLLAQTITDDGHDGAFVVGRIDTITLEGDEYWGEGFLTTDAGIFEVAPMIADNTLRGVSVDLAPSIIEYRSGMPDASGVVEPVDAPVQQTPEESANPTPEVSEGQPEMRESITDMIMAVVAGEIMAATICATPAFADAYIELVTPAPVDPAAEGTPAPDAAPDAAPVTASAPCGCMDIVRVTTLVAAPEPPPEDPSTPEAVPAAQPDHSGGAMICLYPPEASGLAVIDGLAPEELHVTLAYLGDAAGLDATELTSICTELAAGLSAGAGKIAGPAAFLGNDADPDDPDAGNVPLVALIDSDWVTDLYAQLDDALDASGIDQPSEHGFIPHMTLKYGTEPVLLDVASTDLSFPSIWLVLGEDKQEFQCGAAMTASALGAAPETPPSSWFAQPSLDGPTPLTVTDDGRVFGHIATWGTCHTGYAGQCVTAPRSKSGYSYFHLGEVVAANGDRIPCGTITLDTTHATLDKGRRDATLHYEHTGAGVADVRAGEDKYGIWVAGAVRPDVSSVSLRRFRGSKISGDWRSVGGALELIGALAVNVPGFPVPRTQARVASGVVTALVAPQIDALASDDALIDAYALIAEHGDRAIDVLAASALEAA